MNSKSSVKSMLDNLINYKSKISKLFRTATTYLRRKHVCMHFQQLSTHCFFLSSSGLAVLQGTLHIKRTLVGTDDYTRETL